MNDQLIDLDQMAEENFTYEVSDEMLETAAGMEMGKPKASQFHSVAVYLSARADPDGSFI